MGEVARATASNRNAGAGRPNKPDLGDVWDAIIALSDKQDDMGKKIDLVSDTIGKPGTPDNGQPASGIFAHLNAHDQRLKVFENLWAHMKGFSMGATPLLIALWVINGDKVLKLFN